MGDKDWDYPNILYCYSDDDKNDDNANANDYRYFFFFMARHSRCQVCDPSVTPQTYRNVVSLHRNIIHILGCTVIF